MQEYLDFEAQAFMPRGMSLHLFLGENEGSSLGGKTMKKKII
jgi:hypothetical protein